MKKKRKHIIV